MEENKRIWNLRTIARKNGLDSPDLFAEWFAKRFPKETNEHYIAEWVGRFKGGNPTACMDVSSLKVYLDVVGRRYGLSKEKMKKLL